MANTIHQSNLFIPWPYSEARMNSHPPPCFPILLDEKVWWDRHSASTRLGYVPYIPLCVLLCACRGPKRQSTQALELGAPASNLFPIHTPIPWGHFLQHESPACLETWHLVQGGEWLGVVNCTQTFFPLCVLWVAGKIRQKTIMMINHHHHDNHNNNNTAELGLREYDSCQPRLEPWGPALAFVPTHADWASHSHLSRFVVVWQQAGSLQAHCRPPLRGAADPCPNSSFRCNFTCGAVIRKKTWNLNSFSFVLQCKYRGFLFAYNF